jgi:hypothetical protein
MDTERASQLLVELRIELDRLQSVDAAFEAWRRKTASTLRRVLGRDHHLVEDFEGIVWYDTFGDDNSIWGRDHAIGILEGAMFEVRELAEPVDFAGSASIDPELWAYVNHLVEQEKWDQVASQAAIFVESKVREWAGRPNDETTTHLMTAVLRPSGGEFPLGLSEGEKEGWLALGRGFMGALRNADTHRIQDRPDGKRYAMGVLGTASLLLTQLRYEHGNRFRSDAPIEAPAAT